MLRIRGYKATWESRLQRQAAAQAAAQTDPTVDSLQQSVSAVVLMFVHKAVTLIKYIQVASPAVLHYSKAA